MMKKNKTLKHLSALFLCFVLFFSMVPTVALAADFHTGASLPLTGPTWLKNPNDGGNWKWKALPLTTSAAH